MPKCVFATPVFILCLFSAAALAEPLTLADGLKIVTQENRLVKIRQQEEKISHEDAVIARSKLLPSFNASYGQSAFEHETAVRVGSQIIPSAEASFYTYQLAIQQILYDFGGVNALYQSAKLTEETKRLETKSTRNGVALSFATLYFDVLESEKMIAVAEREMESLAAHARVANELLESGLITKNDLLEAEVRLADARQKLLNAQNMRKINGARLDSILAWPLSTPVQVIEETGPRPETPPHDEAVDIAQRERPELQIADAALKALRYEETARKSEYFPKFLAQGERDYAKNKYAGYEANLGITLLMQLNLFSGGSTEAAVEKVQLAQMRLRVERKKLADDIGLELEKYYLDMLNANESVQVAKDAIAQAEESLRITRIKYAEGVGIARDVTDAITLRALSETNYYRALYDSYRSEAGYLYAMGSELTEVYQQ